MKVLSLVIVLGVCLTAAMAGGAPGMGRSYRAVGRDTVEPNRYRRSADDGAKIEDSVSEIAAKVSHIEDILDNALTRPCHKPDVSGGGIRVMYKNQHLHEVTETELPTGAELLVRCTLTGQYVLTGSHIVRCYNGRWSSDMPTCEDTLDLSIGFTGKYNGFSFSDENCKSPWCEITDVGSLHVRKGATVGIQCYYNPNFSSRKPSLEKNGIELTLTDDFSSPLGPFYTGIEVVGVTKANFAGSYMCKTSMEQFPLVVEVVD